MNNEQIGPGSIPEENRTEHTARTDPLTSRFSAIRARDVHTGVQAGNVRGGVHFYGVDRRVDPIRQLPGDVRGFVNRTVELARLDETLTNEQGAPAVVDVLLITGTAGVGKTSLALHWAHRIRHLFPDGQFYANLRGYDPGPPVQPEQVIDHFLRALGVPPAAVPTELEARTGLYRSLLADRRILIVLDNAATVGQVRPLLPGTASCLVVVTSRSQLSGLVIRDGGRRISLNVLPESDAVDLLRNITIDYRRPDEAEKLGELARLCARLPLALRIAAERAATRPLMPIEELINDLRDESALWEALTVESGDEADAVRSVFAWSYRALPSDAAQVFRLLGLQPGPEFGVPATSALVGADFGWVRRQLDLLASMYLLEQSAPGRYQFHDLLRAYATDQVTNEETLEFRQSSLSRLLTWYLHGADAVRNRILPHDRPVVLNQITADFTPVFFADSDAANAWFETEKINLVAATRSALNNGLYRVAWQLAAVLRVIYMMRHDFADWTTTSSIGLEAARKSGNRAAQSELLQSLGMAHFRTRRLADAEKFHRAALTIRKDDGDRLGEAISINALGLLSLRRRALNEARHRFEQSMAIVQELNNRYWKALLLGNLGETYYELNRLDEATASLESAIALCQEIDDRAGEGNDLFYLAMTQREKGEVNVALSSIQAALMVATELGSQAMEAHWLIEFARIQRALGEPATALPTVQRAASIQRRIGDRSREAMALDGAGEAYRELGQFAEASEFHRMAAAIHRELSDQWLEGIARENLAIALSNIGDTEAARLQWIESSRCIADFDDHRSIMMRSRITAAIGHG